MSTHRSFKIKLYETRLLGLLANNQFWEGLRKNFRNRITLPRNFLVSINLNRLLINLQAVLIISIDYVNLSWNRSPSVEGQGRWVSTISLLNPTKVMCMSSHKCGYIFSGLTLEPRTKGVIGLFRNPILIFWIGFGSHQWTTGPHCLRRLPVHAAFRGVWWAIGRIRGLPSFTIPPVEHLLCTPSPQSLSTSDLPAMGLRVFLLLLVALLIASPIVKGIFADLYVLFDFLILFLIFLFKKLCRPMRFSRSFSWFLGLFLDFLLTRDSFRPCS